MAQTFEQALSGIAHGDHCCLFFSSQEEQARITSPFLAIGLERGERCVYVGGPDAVEAVRAGLKTAGVSVDREIEKKRLTLTSAQDYLEGGRWRTEKMLGFLEKAYEGAIADGYSALRATGDVSWQVGPDHDYAEIAAYEALLDMFFIGKRMVGMCQYPKSSCPPTTMSGIMDTHKVAAIDSEICSNFHYVAPDILLQKDADVRGKKRVEWMIGQLLRAKGAEAERDRLQELLLQSQKMEAIGALAGGVAHDFNNILTVILGLGDMILSRTSLDGALRGDVKEMVLAGERASSLTRQLLAFGRRQALNPRVVALNDLVGSMENFLRRIIGANVELQTLLSPELGNVRVDPGRIEQVIMNLAVNARDAMPRGGKLTIETGDVELGPDYAEAHPGVTAGPHVMLAVSDTGHGMDKATLERIFEPFFTTKELGKGTGLGLSVVHGIVEQSGGSLFVYSEPDKGTVFKIYLPRVDAEPAAAPKPRRETEFLDGTETILLVEDDDLVRKLVHRVLVERGYTVLSAISAAEGIKFCERHKDVIHAMITDAVLPRMGGRELAEYVVALRPKMKILFMSGYADDVVARRGARDEAQAFIEKPFTPEVILRKVREVLDA